MSLARAAEHAWLRGVASELSSRLIGAYVESGRLSRAVALRMADLVEDEYGAGIRRAWVTGLAQLLSRLRREPDFDAERVLAAVRALGEEHYLSWGDELDALLPMFDLESQQTRETLLSHLTESALRHGSFESHVRALAPILVRVLSDDELELARCG